MRRSRLTWSSSVVAFVLGLMLTVQFRTQRLAADVQTLPRVETISSALAAVEAERERLQTELRAIRSQAIVRSVEPMDEREIADLIAEAEMAAGMVPLMGPGVKVLMDDSDRPTRPGENPNHFIIHDQDVLRMINDLRAAGAEGLAINGQRLVATSEIRCAGPIITVNGIPTPMPVEITAVGDPDTLARGLGSNTGFLTELRQWGIRVEVRTETELTLPAFRGARRLQHGRPIDEIQGNLSQSVARPGANH